MTRLLAVVLIAGVAGISAQSLSSGCINALTTVAANPDANACLSPSSLVQLAVNSSASVVDPINTWLTNVCSAAPCSNATIAAVVTNITSGCSSDLASFGLTSISTDTLVNTAQQEYPAVRQVLCLDDSGTNCITETLTNIQNIVGPLTITNLIKLYANPQGLNLPNNITCSNCAKATYNVLNQDFPSLVTGEKDSLSSTCGASFVDGTTPSGISEKASTTSTKGKNSAGVLIGSGLRGLLALGVSGLILISTTFALLA